MTIGLLDLTDSQREQLLVNLTKVHNTGVEATIRATGNHVYREFVAGNWLGTKDWPKIYSAIVANAQAQISAQSAAYFAEYAALVTGEAVPLVPVAEGAWMVAADSISATAMPKRFGKLANEGLGRAYSLNQAGRYGSELAAGDLQSAQRVASDAFSAGSSVDVLAWRKLPSGAACGWCLTVSDQVYTSESVPSHAGCRCGVAPVMRGDGYLARGGQQLEGGGWTDIIDDPSAPGAATIPPPEFQIDPLTREARPIPFLP